MENYHFQRASAASTTVFAHWTFAVGAASWAFVCFLFPSIAAGQSERSTPASVWHVDGQHAGFLQSASPASAAGGQSDSLHEETSASQKGPLLKDAPKVPWLWFLQGRGQRTAVPTDTSRQNGANSVVPALYCCLLFAAGAVLWSRWPKTPGAASGVVMPANMQVLKTLRLGRATLYLVSADDSRFLVGADPLGLKQIVRMGDDLDDPSSSRGGESGGAMLAKFEDAMGAWGAGT